MKSQKWSCINCSNFIQYMHIMAEKHTKLLHRPTQYLEFETADAYFKLSIIYFSKLSRKFAAKHNLYATCTYKYNIITVYGTDTCQVVAALRYKYLIYQGRKMWNSMQHNE